MKHYRTTTRTALLALLGTALAINGCSPEGGASDHEKTNSVGQRVGGTQVTTNSASYDVGQTMTVSYSGLPGNSDDWIAIATQGAADTDYLQYVFTGGATSGSATFTVNTAGSYVARAYPNNTFNLLAESAPFTFSSSTAVSTDNASYGPTDTITVTYSGLPGNATDWIGLAADGSPDNSYVQYAYTGGQSAGTLTFSGLQPGSYVARAYPNNTYAKLSESASFDVSGAIALTDSQSYAPDQVITVNFDGMPGLSDDYVTIASLGSPDSSYVQYAYTGGTASGSVTFRATGQGTFVARLFPHNAVIKIGETAPFDVDMSNASTSVSPDQTMYTLGSPITVTYSGLPGNNDDWLALAAQGSDVNSYLAYVYTGGHTSGTATFTAPSAGNFVVRAFPRNTFQELAESAVLDVTNASLSTDASSYTPGTAVTVTFSGLLGNQLDWVGVLPQGAPDTSYTAFSYVNGQASGTLTFSDLPAGTYVARCYPNNSYSSIGQSAAFTVSNATVTTDQVSYATGSTVSVSYAGLAGEAQDWIGIVPQGSPDTSYVRYVFTGGASSGTATFDGLADGTYVARAFVDNKYVVAGSSASFTLAAPAQ